MTETKVKIRSGTISGLGHETANKVGSDQSMTVGRTVVVVRESKLPSRISMLNRRLSGQMKVNSDSSR